jgi:SNF2 family DNA or RNA helicase
MNVTISVVGTNLAIRVPHSSREAIELCKALPDMKVYDHEIGGFLARSTERNLLYLRRAFDTAVWTPEAQTKFNQVVKNIEQEPLDETTDLDAIQDETVNYQFHTEPFPWQLKGFLLSRDRKAFALLMDPRTGKTKLTIDNFCYLFEQKRIDAVLILCPKSIKSVWVDELEAHAPPRVPLSVMVYKAGASPNAKIRLSNFVTVQEPNTLQILIANTTALSSKNVEAMCARFVTRRKGRVMIVVDESTEIKSHTSKRTRAAYRIRKEAEYRRILTGTPVTQGPLDLYSQFFFLDRSILGYDTYTAYKNSVAIFDGYFLRGYRKPVMRQIAEMIKPHSIRVRRDQVFKNLVEPLYIKHRVDLTPEQRRMYDELKENLITEFEGKDLSAAIILTQLQRLSQISGGFMKLDGETEERPVPGGNPKIDALLDRLTGETGKVIIWARFQPEIRLIRDTLAKEYGRETVVDFYGGTSESNRTRNRKAFQDPSSPVRFFVGHVEAGGQGLKLSAADMMIFFSNTYSLEKRTQAEARTEDSQRTARTTYIDLVAHKTVDTTVLAALRSKKAVADLITGDNVKSWL